MKVVSFNVNGIRARLHQIRALAEQHNPDIIGLQEIKVSDDEFPLNELRQIGYDAIWYGQKGHYGVALLHRLPLISSTKGLSGYDNSQKRLITGTYEWHNEPLHIINGYFPQGENRSNHSKFLNKKAFYSALKTYIAEHFTDKDKFVVIGDMNVARLDLDIGIGEQNRKRWLREGKCCFLPEEREWLGELMNEGLDDSYRLLNSDTADRFSWFDYRSKGFDRDPRRGLRIDLLLTSTSLRQSIRGAGIDYTIRAMERPSDHCPAWVEF